MATFSAVIVPAKALKGGRHKVRISVAHNGETRYIVTDITIDSAKEFKNGSIVKREDASILNTKLRGVLSKIQMAYDEIPYTEGLSCSELVSNLKNSGNNNHRTLQSILEEYLENSDAKDSTKSTYMTTWKRITKAIDGNTVLENISRPTIMGLKQHLVKSRLNSKTICTTMTLVRTLLGYAQKNGYVQYRVDPFFGTTLPPTEARDSWLSVEQIKQIRDCELKRKSNRKARDIFMLSYYLGGINMADLCKINFSEMQGHLKYIRQKTENRPKQNKFVEFEIPDEAMEIIERYEDKDGYLSFQKSQREDSARGFIGHNMRVLAKLLGIKNLVFYSARKSFSQHAFNLGVSEPVIDYILGHRVDKASTSLFSYISVTPDMATKAVRKVLDNLK